MTLSSQRSWKLTHEAARRVFMIFGVLVIVASLLRSTWVFAIVIGGLLLATAGLFVYSYMAWRDDPERDSMRGATPRVTTAAAPSPGARRCGPLERLVPAIVAS